MLRLLLLVGGWHWAATWYSKSSRSWTIREAATTIAVHVASTASIAFIYDDSCGAVTPPVHGHHSADDTPYRAPGLAVISCPANAAKGSRCHCRAGSGLGREACFPTACVTQDCILERAPVGGNSSCPDEALCCCQG